MKFETDEIQNLCLGIYDGPHATPPITDSGAIFLGISNITKDGHFNFSDIHYISEEDLPKWTRRVVPQEGDIVFSYEATLNLYGIIPQNFRGCLGRRMALIRPDNKKVLGRYLYYYFFSKKWRGLIQENTITGSTVDRIPLIRFPSFKIDYPEIDVQTRIIDILSAYDELIENNQRQIKLLEEAAQRLYKEWFVDLRFPGHEKTKIVDGVPEGWDKIQLKALGSIVTGKTPSTANADNYGGNIPFVTIPDMHDCIFPIKTERTLSETGANSQKSKFIPKNSLMVSCIGTVGLVNISVELCQTNQQINSLVLKEKKDLYFIFFSLKSISVLLSGIGSNGATMTNVNKAKFESVCILYPKNSLIKLFNDKVTSFFEKIKILSLQNVKLSEARDRLLPKLMNGEIEL